MKKLTRILSLAVAVLMLVAATSVFASAEEGKSYTYTLDFNNLLNENDYFEVFKSEWNNDYAQIAAKRVDFNEIKSGSGPHSKNIGLGIGFGTSECRVYKCVTDKKCYFENDNSGYTTVFKFTAPVKGTYTTYFNIPNVTGALTNTNIFYFIGSDDAGFTMNTEGGTTQGRHDFTHTELGGKYRMTFELEKGQSVAACILAWSNMIYQVEEISVTLTNAAEEPPVITEPPVETDPPINTEPDNDGDTTVTTEVPDSEKSESSGLVKLLGGSIVSAVCAIVAVVVVVGVVVAVIVVKSKKK